MHRGRGRGRGGGSSGFGRSNKTVQTALVWIPDEDQWEDIQTIRRAHDKAYERWMPHINLLYPFVPESNFASAEEILREKLSDFPPFTLEFKKLDYFTHSSSSTLFLVPETTPAGILIELQRTLEKAFPHCNDLSSISEKGFQPHLTLGQFPTSNIKTVKTNFQKIWKPLRFTVNNIHLISREGRPKFFITHTVPLSGTPQEAEEDTYEEHVEESDFEQQTPFGVLQKDQYEATGNILYGMIGEILPDSQRTLCGKITGMILEAMVVDDLSPIFNSPTLLDSMVHECIRVLKSAGMLPFSTLEPPTVTPTLAQSTVDDWSAATLDSADAQARVDYWTTSGPADARAAVDDWTTTATHEAQVSVDDWTTAPVDSSEANAPVDDWTTTAVVSEAHAPVDDWTTATVVSSAAHASVDDWETTESYGGWEGFQSTSEYNTAEADATPTSDKPVVTCPPLDIDEQKSCYYRTLTHQPTIQAYLQENLKLLCKSKKRKNRRKWKSEVVSRAVMVHRTCKICKEIIFSFNARNHKTQSLLKVKEYINIHKHKADKHDDTKAMEALVNLFASLAKLNKRRRSAKTFEILLDEVQSNEWRGSKVFLSRLTSRLRSESKNRLVREKLSLLYRRQTNLNNSTQPSGIQF